MGSLEVYLGACGTFLSGAWLGDSFSDGGGDGDGAAGGDGDGAAGGDGLAFSLWNITSS